MINEFLFNGPPNIASQPVGLFRLGLYANCFPSLSDAAGRYIDPNSSVPGRIQQFKGGRGSIMSGASYGHKPVGLEEYVSHLVSALACRVSNADTTATNCGK